MTGRLSFDQAARLWRKLNTDEQMEEAGLSNAFDNVERLILRQKPQSPGEVDVMLEVLIDNLRSGPRSDSRDIRAARAIQAWVRQSAKAVARSKSPPRTGSI